MFWRKSFSLSWETALLQDYGGSLSWYHEHEYVYEVIEPTCLEKGFTAHICACGYSEILEEMDALGHAWSEATCLQAKICDRCGETEGEPLSHAYENGQCIHCGQSEAPALLKGDADGDGEVTYLDAMLTLQAAVGLTTLDVNVADADDDGAITYLDAMLILQAAVGLITL